MTDGRSAEPTADDAGVRDDGMLSVTLVYRADSVRPAAVGPRHGEGGEPEDLEATRARARELFAAYGAGKSAGEPGEDEELLFRELHHMWADEILRGVEQVAQEHGVGVLTKDFGRKGVTAQSAGERPDHGGEHAVSVAWLQESERRRLRAEGVAFVVYDPLGEVPEDAPSVSATNWKGGRAAVQHLAGLGHCRIAMISGSDHPFCVARVAGYLSGLQEAGADADPELLVRTHITRDHGYAAARELLSRPDRPTAVFTASDLQALGVFQATRELGLSVPGDLSVVGFDDLPVAEWTDPPLTTVRQPLTAMAAAATRLVVALGRGDEVSRTRLDIATTLVVRESTAPPR
ncbi:DNA-binding LacI/PurR family transcriptional regulator [Streptacidiphilus sp. MAP12-33]|uniref:substrate-binding domain-containing protein n=1 Tax=Streptacidiphilus sp. MAP12-33 TaxID=3156266 RepID=UPI003513EADF